MPGTLRYQPQVTLTNDEENCQRAGDDQAMGVLVEAEVADLAKRNTCLMGPMTCSTLLYMRTLGAGSMATDCARESHKL